MFPSSPPNHGKINANRINDKTHQIGGNIKSRSKISQLEEINERIKALKNKNDKATRNINDTYNFIKKKDVFMDETPRNRTPTKSINTQQSNDSHI